MIWVEPFSGKKTVLNDDIVKKVEKAANKIKDKAFSADKSV